MHRFASLSFLNTVTYRARVAEIFHCERAWSVYPAYINTVVDDDLTIYVIAEYPGFIIWRVKVYRRQRTWSSLFQVMACLFGTKQLLKVLPTHCPYKLFFQENGSVNVTPSIQVSMCCFSLKGLVLNMQKGPVVIFHKEGFGQPAASQYWEINESTNISLCFINNIQHNRIIWCHNIWCHSIWHNTISLCVFVFI